MTVNSVMVLDFLKSHYGQEFTKAQIAEELGISGPSVIGSINALVKKGYVTERLEPVEETSATGKVKVTNIRYETLTEAGLTYDPVAEEEAKAAAKAAEKEARAAARAAAKAAKENA